MHDQSQPPRPVQQGLLVRPPDLDTMGDAPLRADWNLRSETAGQDGSSPVAMAHVDLATLVDFSLLNDIFNNFLEVTGLPIAIIDLEGKVLASSKWQRVCLEFHRAHETTRAACRKSDTVLATRMLEGCDCAIYQCAHGLTDCATPITIDGIHVANLFTGQFLLTAPDMDYFRRQQLAHGFDEVAYFKALAEVPIVAEQKIPAVLRLLRGLAQQIARQSVAEKQALFALANVEKQVAERTQTLRESEDHFRILFEGAPVGQLLMDPDSLRVLECNAAAAAILGYSRGELCGLGVRAFDATLDAEAIRALQEQLLNREQVHLESVVRRKDGELRDVSMTAVLLRAAEGNRVHATYIDVTDRKRAERREQRLKRTLRLLGDCNLLLARAADERALLSGICRRVVDTGGYPLAWIGFAAADAEKSVRPVAQCGHADGAPADMQVSWDETQEAGRGPTAAAIRTGTTQIVRNGHASPAESRCQASIALPLVIQQGARGALTLAATQPDAFGAEEVVLLEELACNVAFGIQTLRSRLSREAAEAALHESAIRHRILLDNLPQTVWQKDRDSVYVGCNATYARSLGIAAEDLRGKTDYDFYPADLAEKYRADDRRIIDLGAIETLEEQWLSGGEPRFVQTTKMPLRNEQGWIYGTLGIAEDVTARRQADIALRLERDRNQKYLDTVQALMVVLDAAGRISMINRAGCKLLGYAEGDLLGRNWFETCVPQPAGTSRMLPEFQRIMAGVRPLAEYHEDLVLCRDGTPRLIAWRNACMTDEAGQIVGALGCGQDITAQRRDEEQLRKLAQAVEQSPQGIAITNLQADIEYVNEAFVRNTGYRRDEVIGRNPRILGYGKTPPETYVRLWEALKRGRTWQGELYNRRKDGSEFVEFAFITPIHQADGQVSHYVAVKEDITERKRNGRELDQYRHHLEELVRTRTRELAQAKEAAEAANSAKSQFLATMSHEIRTPLHLIVGLAHLLRRELADRVQLERVDQLCATSEHLAAIINDILDLSKIEARQLALNCGDFSLDAVVDSVVRMLAPRARDKGLTLTTEVAPALRGMALHGDSLRLAQVLINLCGNAVKFTDQGHVQLGIVRLQDDADSVALRFVVADTGIGIAAADQARLFQPFSQIDSSSACARGGTGLGLVISQRLVALMGGTIQLDSQPGTGSTFSFELILPRAAASVPELAATAAAACTPDLYGRHILLAEDHPLGQEILFEMLEDLGCEVDAASDGVEALECVQARRYDLILMDMQMPRMDGLAATRAIRALPWQRDTPIIALTANAFAEDHRRCLDAGMNGHIGKPVTPATLAAALRQWLPDLAVPGADTPPCDNELSRTLAKIPGLDVRPVWRRSPEKLSEYCAQLDCFLTLHGQDMARLRELLATGERDAAAVVVHQLKGIAGLIGARRIADQASEIMQGLRTEADADAMQNLAAECEAELGALTNAVRTLAATGPDPAAT